MNIITREEFKGLINYESDPCISIYIPTHHSGVAASEKQDALIFSQALHAAHDQLKARGLHAEEIEELLKPGFDLHSNEVFWKNQMDGLAVFLAKGFSKTIQLPFKAAEKVYVNTSFYVTPVVPAIIKNEEFYLLVLSKQDTRFYQGNEFGLQRLEFKGMKRIDSPILVEDPTGLNMPNEIQPVDKVSIGNYFQEIDKVLFTEVLHGKHVPLVLAGVEYLIPIYKSISRYKLIAEHAITGNRERENLKALFERARTLLLPYFEQRTKTALKNYYTQIATPATSSMPEKIIPASYYAQVSDLFISKDTHLWGRFDEAENKLEIHRDQEIGDHCLLNQAAAKTFMNGGNVFMLDRAQMPKESIIAASFRF